MPASDEEMPTVGASESSSNKKRKAEETVHPDTSHQLTESKKPRFEPDNDKKVKCLKFLLIAAHDLAAKVGFKRDDWLNITLSRQIANILFTVHNALRQEARSRTSDAFTKAQKGEFSLTIANKKYILNTNDAKTIVETAARKVELEYKAFAPEEAGNWYGVAGPYLNFFVAFDLRKKELRLGHGKMPVKKTEAKITYHAMSSYGINGGHHIHLEGITYPPEKRSSMAQSLGPLTALMCYYKTIDNYQNKFKIAAKRALSHVPFIDDILEGLKGKQAVQVAPMFEVLGDILCIATSRQAQRATFPILSVLYVSTNANKDGTSTFNEQFIQLFNASGHGAFYTWSQMCGHSHVMCGNMTASQASQIVFHSVWGTFKEDFGVLRGITDFSTWSTREQLGSAFKEMGTSETSVTFQHIKYTKYSKLCGALMTPVLATNYIQTCSAPEFSGTRKHSFSDEFFANTEKRLGITLPQKSWDGLISGLKQIFHKLVMDVKTDGETLEMGTTKWRSMQDMTISFPGSPIEHCAETSGEHFLGRSRID